MPSVTQVDLTQICICSAVNIIPETTVAPPEETNHNVVFKVHLCVVYHRDACEEKYRGKNTWRWQEKEVCIVQYELKCIVNADKWYCKKRFYLYISTNEIPWYSVCLYVCIYLL